MKNNTISKYVIYCLSCKKYMNNIVLKNIAMTNKVFRKKIKIIVCLFGKLK